MPRNPAWLDCQVAILRETKNGEQRKVPIVNFLKTVLGGASPVAGGIRQRYPRGNAPPLPPPGWPVADRYPEGLGECHGMGRNRGFPLLRSAPQCRQLPGHERRKPAGNCRGTGPQDAADGEMLLTPV